MEKSLYDQSSVKIHGVVNYSSRYGGFFFRSPNSYPDSHSLSPLNQIFFNDRFNNGSPSPIYCSSPAGFFRNPQPPLLPLPRSATLPAGNVRSRRRGAKRKGKMFIGDKKSSVNPINVEEDLKQKMEMNLKEEEEEGEKEDIVLESVFSLSPPPSSLPFPKFSLIRGRSGSKVSVNGGSVAGFCLA